MYIYIIYHINIEVVLQVSQILLNLTYKHKPINLVIIELNIMVILRVT